MIHPGLDAMSAHHLDNTSTHHLEGMRTHQLDTTSTHQLEDMITHRPDSTSTHQLEGMSTHWPNSTSTQQFSSTISTIIHQLAMDIYQFNSHHRLASGIHSFHAMIAYHNLAVAHHDLGPGG
jgi:hypothetical protein